MGKMRYAWWIVGGLTLVTIVIGGRLTCISNDAHTITGAVPIGSQLADLDQYLESWDLDSGDVMQLIATNEPPDRDDSLQIRMDGVRIKTDFGTFLQEDLGPYDAWSASAEERNMFTGDISFFHFPHWNAEVLWFMYIDGKLVQAVWGKLPG